MRPYIFEREKYECQYCSYGYIKYKTSGGNKAKKMCDNCCGTGILYADLPSGREATDEEWLEQLEQRITALEEKGAQ